MARMQDLRPKMKRRGMFHMKDVSVRLAHKYEDFSGGHLPQLGFLGYLYEVCNLSDGRRKLSEIHRMLGHELSIRPEMETLVDLVKDMEMLDYMTVES